MCKTKSDQTHTDQSVQSRPINRFVFYRQPITGEISIVPLLSYVSTVVLCIISCVRAVLTSTRQLPFRPCNSHHFCFISVHRRYCPSTGPPSVCLPCLLPPHLFLTLQTVSIDAVCTISRKTVVKTWANSTCIDRRPATDGRLCQGLLLALTNALTGKCSTRSYQFCSISVHPPLLLPRSAIPCNLGAPPFPTLQMQCPSTPFAPYMGYSIVLTTTPHGQ